MLRIEKNGVAFTLANDGETLVSTKLVLGKVCRIITIIDGTTAEFSKRVTKIASMSDDEFFLFSSIQDEHQKEN